MQYLAISISVVIGLVYIVYLLAQENIFWTTDPPEGTAKAIVRGATADESGSFVRFIHSYKDHYLDESNEVRRGDRVQPRYLAWLGVYWVGIYPLKSVLEYHFKWTEQQQDSEGAYRSVARKELTRLIFLKKTQYTIILEEAESAGQIPATLKIILTLKITNLFRAIFETDDWLTRVSSAVIGSARRYVGEMDYGDLAKEGAGERDQSTFANRILDLNYHLAAPEDLEAQEKDEGLITRYGITLLDAEIQEVKTKEELENAVVVEKVAKEEAKAIIARAEGEATSIKTIAAARAEEVNLVMEAAEQHESGDLFITTEALKEASKGSGNTIVWAGGLRELINSLRRGGQ